MSKPSEAQPSTPAKSGSSTNSTSSNSLLDLLAGAPNRITSPTPKTASVGSTPTATQQPPSPSPSSSSTTTVTAPQDNEAATMSGYKHPQDVSHLMQKFTAKDPSPLLVVSPNSKSEKNPFDSIEHAEEPSKRFAKNKSLQLPPSPPSSVSSANGSRLRQPSSGLQSPITSTPPNRDLELEQHDAVAGPSSEAASPPKQPPTSVKTPFDFISPFDLLSNRDDVTPQPQPSASEPPAPAHTSTKRPADGTNEDEEAPRKLSAHAAAHRSHQLSAIEPHVNVSADAINAALSSTITEAIDSAISANLSSSFDKAISSTIPTEVERLIQSTELKNELTRNIVQSILPGVQRTAMEVVSRVLAPHFEDVMMQVSERVEKAIVSELTSARRSLVEEQSSSLRDTEKMIQSIQGQVDEVLKQVKDLHQGQKAAAKIVAAKITSGDEASDAEPAKTRKAAVKHDRQRSHESNAVASSSSNAVAVQRAVIPTKCALPAKVAVVGAGPVGCLAALAFAQRGCSVDIFETRPDPRTHDAVARASQRSINLALSTRGITGLRSVSLVGLGKQGSTLDLADLVLQESVPMRARMIHVVTQRAVDGQKAEVKEVSQQYSTNGEAINSVDRGRLNNILLEHAAMHPNVRVHFEHKLSHVDFDHDSRSKKNLSNGKGKAKSEADRVKLDFDVHSTNQKIAKSSNTHFASVVVGCDGAHSSIRSSMGSLIRMHYTHNYIDTGYVELHIPPRTPLGSGQRVRGDGGLNGTKGGHDAFHLDPNHLHIWPKHSFMLIALPNLDGSFTCTLFAPFAMFAAELSTKEGILAFFEENFPDALPLIGEDRVVECLTTRRPSALGSVQCDPYHYKDRAVLIGDAAHAMLPFYGQGLNCGFEDVRVLFDIIDGHEQLEGALDRYTKERHPDLKAILKLAEDNYREMAHSVVSWPYLLRKKLDGLLMAVLPSSMWSSLYAMTTFSNLPYSQVIKTEKRQQRIIGNAIMTTVVGIMTGAVVGAYRTRGVWQPVTKGWIESLQNKA